MKLELSQPISMFTLAALVTCGVLAFRTLSGAITDSPRFDREPNMQRGFIRATVGFVIAVATATDIVMMSCQSWWLAVPSP